jgi:hypothetical protein
MTAGIIFEQLDKHISSDAIRTAQKILGCGNGWNFTSVNATSEMHEASDEQAGKIDVWTILGGHSIHFFNPLPKSSFKNNNTKRRPHEKCEHAYFC